MKYRNFKIGKVEKEEIILFDILYRLNSNPDSKCHRIIDKSADIIDPYYQNLLNNNYIKVSEKAIYCLTDQGKEKIVEYGKMFQKFKDLAIFKCVYPDGNEPDESEPDDRFGAINEEANPPESEDYRIAIFENFAKRQNRHAPLHLIAFFSQIENEPLHSKGEHWLYDLIGGKFLSDLEDTINSQLSAEAIAPEGWTEDEIIDVIYEAGMRELNRCFEEDRNKFSAEGIQENESDFWVEETVYEDEYDDYDDFYDRDPYYYDPYWEYDAAVGSALVVGAFAGLATCALLF
jgi:predicted transcriptional regulator